MKILASGTIHLLKKDIAQSLHTSDILESAWQSLTPLARNEWICWIESAKKTETRIRRIAIMCDQLHRGYRRPCCWAGCPHRNSKH